MNTETKTGLGTQTPDDSHGSYGESSIEKTSNEGKGGTAPATAPVVPATPAGVTPMRPGVAPQMPPTR
jgi:hypothetical protein